MTSEQGGFFIIGGEDEMKAEMDRRTMEAQEFRMSVDRLVDEMSADQTYTLFRLLRHFMSQPESIHFMAGQLSLMMRKVHKMCASCGGKHIDTEHLMAEAGPPNQERTIDLDNLRSLEDILDAFSVSLLDPENPDGQVSCRKCGEIFENLQERVQYNDQVCPGCHLKRTSNDGEANS